MVADAPDFVFAWHVEPGLGVRLDAFDFSGSIDPTNLFPRSPYIVKVYELASQIIYKQQEIKENRRTAGMLPWLFWLSRFLHASRMDCLRSKMPEKTCPAKI
jgi:hypothetical protein